MGGKEEGSGRREGKMLGGREGGGKGRKKEGEEGKEGTEGKKDGKES